MRNQDMEANMSDYLALKTAVEISDWMEHNHSVYCPDGGSEPVSLQGFIEYVEEDRPDALPDGMLRFGVEHTVFTEDGWPLVSLERVYMAKNAEEALAQYVFGPSKHLSGSGDSYVGVILRTNLTDWPQEIKVFEMAEGTDSFY